MVLLNLGQEKWSGPLFSSITCRFGGLFFWGFFEFFGELIGSGYTWKIRYVYFFFELVVWSEHWSRVLANTVGSQRCEMHIKIWGTVSVATWTAEASELEGEAASCAPVGSFISYFGKKLSEEKFPWIENWLLMAPFVHGLHQKYNVQAFRSQTEQTGDKKDFLRQRTCSKMRSLPRQQCTWESHHVVQFAIWPKVITSYAGWN